MFNDHTPLSEGILQKKTILHPLEEIKQLRQQNEQMKKTLTNIAMLSKEFQEDWQAVAVYMIQLAEAIVEDELEDCSD